MEPMTELHRKQLMQLLESMKEKLTMMQMRLVFANDSNWYQIELWRTKTIEAYSIMDKIECDMR